MIHVSNAFRQELVHDRRQYEVTAVITLADDTVLTLTNANIIASGLTIDDAISSDTAFQALGGCVINSATLIVNNRDDAFSEYDFQNARVVIFLQLLNEQIRKGTFRVDKTAYNGFSITLTMLDYMENFDRPYSRSSLTYPATLDNIVRDACTCCGVTLRTLSFPHNDFVIPTVPPVESTTFRDVLKWVSTIAGCFARCDVNGQLELKWFDTDSLDEFLDNVDGGSFDSSDPYSTGDNVDGGIFNPWNVGASIDAGQFGSELPIHYLSSIYSQTVAVEDSVITGVRIVIKGDVDSQSAVNTYTYTSGQSGYVIEIANNAFITEDNAQEIATWLGAQLIGLRFRGLTITHTNDPTIEAGDVGVVFDRKGNQYLILITRTNFKISGRQTTVSASETVSKNTATRYSEATKLYVESRKQLVKVNNRLEDRQDELEQQLAEAGGLYKTEVEVTPGGATRIYYHNKPDLEESDIIMLFSDVGFTVSADGGDTWYGLTVDGQLIASILYTIGVNADWINTGELVISKTEQGVTKEMFYANVDTGVVRIVADSFSFSTGETVDSIAQSYTNEIKQHFWVDNGGVHIASIPNDSSTEFNSLWNSASGMLFRHGVNNLIKLALNNLTFYDGTGNTNDAILASFGTQGIKLGRTGNNVLSITPQRVVSANKNGTTLFELHTNLGVKEIESAVVQYADEMYYVDVTGGSDNDTAEVTTPDELLLGENADIAIKYGRIYGSSQKTENTYRYAFTPGTASQYILVCDTYQRIQFIYDGNKKITVRVYNQDGYEAGTQKYYFELQELAYDVTERYPAFTLGPRTNGIVGAYSLRAGEDTEAEGYAAVALGQGTKAPSDNSTALGKYNNVDMNNALSVGVGTDDENREDAFWVDKNGGVGIVGTLYAGQSVPSANKSKLFVTDSATEDNINISANDASGTIMIDISKTDYTPFALRGLRINNATTNGTNASSCSAYSFRIDGDYLICAIKNNSANAAKIKVIAHIMYIAESAL